MVGLHFLTGIHFVGLTQKKLVLELYLYVHNNSYFMQVDT